MSDDVKVKFGGDFSDVATGAQAATKMAGGALSSWYGDFSKSMTSSIVGSMALTSIFGKFTQGISDALHYFRELDLTMRRIGGSGAEFQQLAGVGKQIGVSMEGVGRSLNFFNKYVGQAAQGSKSHTEALIKMGFTQDQIKKGEISAIEVISQMADQYDKTGNDTIVAAQAMEMFGRQGSQLIPIIKMGSEELRNMTKEMKVYSEETIRRLSEAEHKIEKFKKTLEKMFYREPLIFGANLQSGIEMEQLVDKSVSNAIEGGGTTKQSARSAYNYIKSEVGDNPVALRDAMREAKDQYESIKGQLFASSERKDVARQLVQILSDKIKEIETAPKKEIAVEQGGNYGNAALFASSLQSIGGGDITSVMSGLGANEVADNTKRTADGVQKLVEKNVDQTPVSDVAK